MPSSLASLNLNCGLLFCSPCTLDGQKIAKRLATNIAKETRTVKKLLEDYNIASSVVTASFTPYTLNDILSPESNFWQRLTFNPHCKEIPWNVQKDIMSAYVLIKRTEEELSLLSEEMENVLLYCIQRKECILHQLDSIKNNESQYTKGITSLLHKLLWEVELYHSRAVATFAKLDIHHASSSVNVLSSTNPESDISSDEESESDSFDESDEEKCDLL